MGADWPGETREPVGLETESFSTVLSGPFITRSCFADQVLRWKVMVPSALIWWA